MIKMYDEMIHQQQNVQQTDILATKDITVSSN